MFKIFVKSLHSVVSGIMHNEVVGVFFQKVWGDLLALKTKGSRLAGMIHYIQCARVS